MKKLYYIKEGRRYVPVSEYDSDLLDSLPKGNHLVSVYPGGASRRYSIDPAYAPMIAAGRVAHEAITDSMRRASELKPQKTPLTPEQQQAWKRLADSFGEDICTLNGSSAYDIAEAGVQAMIQEADKLLSNPTVRKAYERFLIVCELSREQESK
jgi:hypothetical protein